MRPVDGDGNIPKGLGVSAMQRYCRWRNSIFFPILNRSSYGAPLGKVRKHSRLFAIPDQFEAQSDSASALLPCIERRSGNVTSYVQPGRSREISNSILPAKSSS